jgi:hypothetical protein
MQETEFDSTFPWCTRPMTERALNVAALGSAYDIDVDVHLVVP